MTARHIQRRFLRDLYQRSTVLPNYTPKGWWECDVAEWTLAGYFREYEIKISLSDFRADAEKRKSIRTFSGWRTKEQRFKHSELGDGKPIGPVQFWYACPTGLIPHELIPHWAGLIEFRPPKNGQPWSVHPTEVKKAPRLHGEKADPAIVAHAKSVTYWRFLRLFIYGKDEPQVEQPVVCLNGQEEVAFLPGGPDGGGPSVDRGRPVEEVPPGLQM